MSTPDETQHQEIALAALGIMLMHFEGDIGFAKESVHAMIAEGHGVPLVGVLACIAEAALRAPNDTAPADFLRQIRDAVMSEPNAGDVSGSR